MSDTHESVMTAAEQSAPAGSTVPVNAAPAPAGEVEQQLANHDTRLAQVESWISKLAPLVDDVAAVAETASPKNAASIASAHSLIQDIFATWKSHFGWSVPTKG